jgi:acetyl esterase/lipase
MTIFLGPVTGFAQTILNLYPADIPNSRQTTMKEANINGMFRNVTVPTIEMYLPDNAGATGAAVVICPGGGYSVVVYQGEGISTAKEFARHGIAAFVLKYRLPSDSSMIDKSIGPLQDAQQAIKVVRENAAKWHIDPNKIGIIGFSAGGHLAASEATHYNKVLIKNESNTSLRPSFQILVYPVISMQDSLGHADSRTKLLGTHPTKAMTDDYSNELQVQSDSPPAYITHAADDKVVDVDNSIKYFEALRHNNIDAELHIFPKGGHGFIFRQKGWMEPLFLWMKNNNWINKNAND